MKMSDLTGGALWSILPGALTELCAHMETAAAAQTTDARMQAYFQKTAARKEKPYTLDRGVAVIPVTGPLTKRGTFFSFLFGSRSYTGLTQSVTAALADHQVKAILLDIDSPGGTVDGTEAFAHLIRQADQVKPVVAFANGTMTSAAYWTGSAARYIIAESTADIGSIGVLRIHYDYSQMDRKEGLKRTFITAGQYKALGNSAEPLSDTARSGIQSQLDYIYDLFIAAVAQNRRVSADTVRDHMADGRIFIGRQAVENHLADAVGTFAQALDKAATLGSARTTAIYPVTAIKEETMPAETTNPQPPAAITTVDALAAAYPDLVRQIRDQARADVDTDPIRTEAAAAESNRILALAAIQFGDDIGNAFAAIVNTRVTAEQLTAIRAAAPNQEDAEDKTMAAMLNAIQQAGPDDPGSQTNAQGPRHFTAAWKSIQAEQNCTRTEAMRAAARQYPKLHKAFIQAANSQ